MNANVPRLRPALNHGPRLHGADLFLVVAIGLGLFWLAQALWRGVMADAATPEARINVMLGVFLAWVLAWLAAIWIVYIRRRGLSFADLGYVVAEPKWAVRGVIAGFIALPAAFALYLALSPLFGERSGPNARELLGGDAFTAIHALTMLLYTGFLVPITEEILFRGILFRWLRQRLDFWPAAAISAALFAAAHQRIDQMAIVAALGLALAWLTERSRSLVPAILMHQTYNSLTMMLTFAAVWFAPEAQK